MRLVIGLFILFISVGASSELPFVTTNSTARPAALGNPQQVNREIKALVQQHSSCHNTRIGNRGRFSGVPGYFNGMVYSFIRSACRPGSDSIRHEMANGENSTRNDGLAPYFNGSNNGSERDLLISTRLLTLSMGMWESSGKFWEGVDVTNSASQSRSVSAEAGLFQTSYDVRGVGRGKPWADAIASLEDYYRQHPELCMVEEFSEGLNVPGNLRQNIGDGEGADFQELMRSCPALAAEHIMITARHNRRHYGPLRRQDAVPIEACRPLFETIYDNAQQNSSYCEAYGLPDSTGSGSPGANTFSRE